MRNPRIPSRSAHRDSIRAVPELLKAKDLETLLKIDVKTIYGYIRRGLIPSFCLLRWKKPLFRITLTFSFGVVFFIFVVAQFWPPTIAR